MRIFWLAVIPACVASVDALYIAGDDVDDEDTTQHAASTGPVTFDNSHGDYIDWHNDQGTYRIYKRCLGPKPGADYIGYQGTVGPGYIATVWNRNRQIVLDDSKVPLELGPNSGAVGLGMFGLHLLRVPFRRARLDNARARSRDRQGQARRLGLHPSARRPLVQRQPHG